MPLFKKPRPHEYYSLVLATVVLLVVLATSFICLQLYIEKKPERGCERPLMAITRRKSLGSREQFSVLGPMVYRPCFIDPYGAGRDNCKGYTSGLPPSIEVEQEGDWLCPGLLGTLP